MIDPEIETSPKRQELWDRLIKTPDHIHKQILCGIFGYMEACEMQGDSMTADDFFRDIENDINRLMP